MKTVIALDISDEQRNNLACLLSGKLVKRLATREEVRDYVNGAIERLSEAKADLACGLTPHSSSEATVHQGVIARTAQEAEHIAKLRAQGRSDSYIIGWLKPGRNSPFTRTSAAAPVEIIVDSEDPTP